MENRASYSSVPSGSGSPDPFDELRELLEDGEAAWLVQLIRLINQAGGWGKIELVLKRSRLSRPMATVSAGGEDCNL